MPRETIIAGKSTKRSAILGVETLPFRFLGLEDKHADYGTAQFAVLPVPYDLATSFMPGARNAPNAIIAASDHVEWFDEELEEECYRCGIATLDAIEPNTDGPAAMQAVLAKAAGRIVRDGKFMLSLGGDHSITAGLVRGVMSKHKKLSILQIDAHLDLRDRFLGSRHSHACVMRRVHELGASIVPVGIRAMAPEEHRFARRAKIHPVTARDCMMEDDWVDRVMDGLLIADSCQPSAVSRQRKGSKAAAPPVYITIDIDGFDPACAPGTGTPEPGGLDWYQVISLLRIVCAERTVVGADIVEVAPIPGQVVTEFLAARLAYKLMAYVQAGG